VWDEASGPGTGKNEGSRIVHPGSTNASGDVEVSLRRPVVVFPAKIPYACFIVSEYGGFEREAGPFVKLWAGVCSVLGWRCRCPHCGGRMKREIAPDESYRRSKRVGPPAGPVRMAGQLSTLQTSGRPYQQVEITPTYDVCTECGHRIRRRNVKSTVG